jgi:hypothetical protein
VTHEGVVFIGRIAVVLLLILVGAIVRTFVGPSSERGLVIGVGMLGGMVVGVAFSYFVRSLRMQESAVVAVSGMLCGFGVAWLFAKGIPRRAN